MTALIVVASIAAYGVIGAFVARWANNLATGDHMRDKYEQTTTAEIMSLIALWPIVVAGAAAWFAVLRPVRNFVMAPLRRRFEDD